MKTNHRNAFRDIYNDRDIVQKQGVINFKIAEMLKHINSYFEIDGLKYHSELLKDLMFVYMSQAEEYAKSEAGYNDVSDRVYASMELMGFFAILFEYHSAIKKLEGEIAYIKEDNTVIKKDSAA